MPVGCELLGDNLKKTETGWSLSGLPVAVFLNTCAFVGIIS